MNGLLRNKFTYFYTIIYMNNHSFLQEINIIILHQKKLLMTFPNTKEKVTVIYNYIIYVDFGENIIMLQMAF